MYQVPDRVLKLLDRGVNVPSPASIDMGHDVDPERIAKGVTLHDGTRLRGPHTSIGPGSEIGAESPATIENCQIGANVKLKGGYFCGSTFLDRSSMGSGAHVRAGTILEEEANGAHSVGLKQTVLFPFVTLGSLINFCDCLMAGGTSRKNHSEVGSSYIHFNYTPHQDKATASLIGDVPHGVLLDRDPIFLGGQGGLVGPARVAYGSVVAAGTILRGDVTEENQLVIQNPPKGRITRDYITGAYGDIERIVIRNLEYIGNIQALQIWYRLVRQPFMTSDPYAKYCYEGLQAQVDRILDERLTRLGQLAAKMEKSLRLVDEGKVKLPGKARQGQERLRDRFAKIEAVLKGDGSGGCGTSHREKCLSELHDGEHSTYLDAVVNLSPEGRQEATAWLNAVVGYATDLWEADE